MTARLVRVLLSALLLFGVSANALAQSSAASSLSGVVTDTDGGTIPGATVIVKNNATGVSIEAVSNSTGRFAFPSLDAGTYTYVCNVPGHEVTMRGTLSVS